MQRLPRHVLLIVAALSLASAAHAVPLHLHVEGLVYVDPLDPVPPLLGISHGDPMTIDLYYDPAAAGSYYTHSSGQYETAYYPYGNPAFSLTIVLGSATLSNDWATPAYQSAFSAVDDTFYAYQDYQLAAKVGSGPGCSPFCADFTLIFRDDVDPLELLSGASILQIPDLSASSTVFGSIEGFYTGGQASYLTVVTQSYSLEVVPEPGTGLLLAVGLAVLARARSRR